MARGCARGNQRCCFRRSEKELRARLAMGPPAFPDHISYAATLIIQPGRELFLKRCARESAGGATAQVVPGHRLLQLSGLEAILSSVLDRREDRVRRPATHGRASINLALFPRQSRINNDSWNREPDGAPANETPKRLWHGGALRCIGVAITCGDLSGTNGAHMVHY
jgi:hypothetical protein